LRTFIVSGWRRSRCQASRKPSRHKFARLTNGRGALASFLRRFAIDTKRGDGASFEPRETDRAATLVAAAVRAALETSESLFDFREQPAFAIAKPQRQVAIGFESRAIGRIGKWLVAFAIHRTERTLGLGQEIAFAAFE